MTAPRGPGHPPTNLHEVIAYARQADGAQVPVNVIDRVVETIGGGAFLHDAAARVGVSVETLRRWRTHGQAALRDILAGRRRLAELTEHEQRCAELVGRMEAAEADAKVRLSGQVMRVGLGGQTRVETTERRDAQGNLTERITRTVEAPPDGHALTWFLSHRWPDDYGRSRVEVTGPGGGALHVTVEPIAERLRSRIDSIRANTAAADGSPVSETTAALAANGNGHANGHTDGNGNGASPEP